MCEKAHRGMSALYCYFPSREISATMVAPHSIGVCFRSIDVYWECLN